MQVRVSTGDTQMFMQKGQNFHTPKGQEVLMRLQSIKFPYNCSTGGWRTDEKNRRNQVVVLH